MVLGMENKSEYFIFESFDVASLTSYVVGSEE